MKNFVFRKLMAEGLATGFWEKDNDGNDTIDIRRTYSYDEESNLLLFEEDGDGIGDWHHHFSYTLTDGFLSSISPNLAARDQVWRTSTFD